MPTKLGVDIQIRERMAADVPFITHAWMEGAKHTAPYRGILGPIRSHYEHRLIEEAWRDPRVVWLVAAWPQDVNFCYGFLCGEATDAGPMVHWVYVRKHMTRMGVGTALMEDFLRGQDRTKGIITHETPEGLALIHGGGGRLGSYVYNPFPWWNPAFRQYGEPTKARRL